MTDAPELAGLQPIASPTRLYEVVTEAISAYIEQAGLRPGDRIPSERELAARLRVSRASVGKAMTELRVMGLIEIRHGDGAYLRRPLDTQVSAAASAEAEGASDDVQLGEVRLLLESRAARLAAERRRDSDLQRLSQALLQMRLEVGDRESGLDGQRRFHLAMWQAAHNSVLNELLTGLSARIDQLSEVSLAEPGQPEASLHAHDLVYQAIVSRDAVTAEQLMLDLLPTLSSTVGSKQLAADEPMASADESAALTD